MLKEEALKELGKIQQEYEKWKNDKGFISNEKQICESLIKPFIKNVLGWNTSDFSEFKVEYSERGKRMDMLVCLDGISQFVIEAKALTKEIIDNREFYNQAINYAHSKEKTFAILTNFKQWIVLRCDIAVSFPERAQIGIIDLTDFEQNRFDKLVWNFNREDWIKQGNQNPLYSELGNLKKKRPIDEQLLEDMKNWRMSFLTNLKKYPRKNHFELENEKEIMHIEEEIQRFIDRLIFICYCEDKELNEPRLKSLKVDKYERFSGKPFLLDKTRELFNDYRREYNSDLFNVGMCDGFFFDDSVLYKVLEDLREPKEKIPYDFESIEVDILGRTYENFIGHLIKGKKRFKEEKSKGKRKEEGIYYTPQFIVNSIVKNTVRECIKNKNYEEIKKIKILDLACGSGSFLIKVFDILVEECTKKIEHILTYEEKKDLLLNCIFGVDKDERACDIAKLNLSLKLAEKGKKLPELHNNIRNGDSIIKDPEITDYAFDWDEKFKDILQDGMFNVIVGNPPYGATTSKEEKEYLNKEYSDVSKGEIETFALFYNKSISLLRDGGYLGFITPDGWFTNLQFSKLREKFINKGKINYVLDTYKPFQDAKDTRCHVLIFQKGDKSNSDVIVEMVDPRTCRNNRLNIIKSFKVKWNYFIGWGDEQWEVYQTEEERELIKKIKRDTRALGKISWVRYGIRTGDNKKYIKESPLKSNDYKVVSGSDMDRYLFNWNKKYLISTKGISEIYFSEKTNKEKIVIQYVRTNSIDPNCRWLESTIIGKEFLGLNSTTMVFKEDKDFPLVYLLGLINSKLMNRYYKLRYTDVNVKPAYLSELPIKQTSEKSKKDIIELVNEILNLNKKLIANKNQYEIIELKKKINKIDLRIDQEVYKVYNLTDSEIKIVEDSLK